MDDALAIAAANWLGQKGYDVIAIDDQKINHQTESWANTATQLGKHLTLWSVAPHSPTRIFKFSKTFLDQWNRVQVKSQRLEDALTPYLQTALVTGLKLGRLSEGNTRVVAFVDASKLEPNGIHQVVRSWLNLSESLRRIGRSPGQNVGEAVWGAYALGLTGFRVNQPAEIYPIILYNDEARFRAGCNALLSNSVFEIVQRRDSVKSFLLPEAPVYCQLILVCTASKRVAFLQSGRESRSAWRHYKKPKLAERILKPNDMPRF